jgi:GT2 family glycosyltransferase
MVKGVTYGTFRQGPHGEPYPDRGVVKQDFENMAQAGFNSVRTYTVPPIWLLDDAAEAGLRVMVGLAWEQHLAFLEEAGRATAIERRIREEVSRCAGHPAILCYAVGNEIPSSIVRWSGKRNVERHIRRLWSATKETDSDGLVAYVNYPSTEYLDLPFLDLVAFNVYLESVPRLSSYIARLQNLAGDRPLLMAELGLDSRRNGLTEQARLVPAQVRAAGEGGCAGVFMFSWTDEWHRGGRDVDDWDFGLTSRDRSPKPVLEAVRRSLEEPPIPPSGHWPRISVVVAAFNAEGTLEECLAGLEALRYPDYEVIVVDDGSTDDTGNIAGRFEVEVIRTENRGLSLARNTGIDASSGEIVAFIDADAYPDPDWLTYLALSFERSDFVGMGGPNIPPPESGMIASCVANAPGGPVHVLRTDHEAEHVPGCNMAFRRWALQEIGGFDPRFRVAGDDVDLCWRIQARGWRIGFSPGAVVWHHPRQTVAGYWKQQCGYGRAEALLEAKWPEKYNLAGHVTWGGRVYGPGALLFPLGGGRIYGGTWGQAAYQQREITSSGVLWDAAAMPEWFLALLLLLVLTLLGLTWRPLLLAGPLLLFGVGTSLFRALVGGMQARFPRERFGRGGILRYRALTATLHLLQPLARLRGRFLSGLVPWRVRGPFRRFKWPRPHHRQFWRWVGESQSSFLGRLHFTLDKTGHAVRSGGGYDDWDLEVEMGPLGAARVRACIEWHGENRQLLRVAVVPRVSRLASIGVVGGTFLSAWAFLDGATTAALVLLVTALALLARSLWERGASTAAVSEGLAITVEGGVELPTNSGRLKTKTLRDDLPNLRSDPPGRPRLRATG